MTLSGSLQLEGVGCDFFVVKLKSFARTSSWLTFQVMSFLTAEVENSRQIVQQILGFRNNSTYSRLTPAV